MALVALMGAALMGCAGLRDLRVAAGLPAPDDEAVAEAVPGLNYEVAIAGVPETELMALLEQSSQLVALKDRPPPSLASLRRRTDADRERLDAVLRSEGFYAADVRANIDDEASPIKVTINVSTGVPYLLADYDVQYQGAAPPAAEARPNLDDLGLYIGMATRAPTIVTAQRVLLETLARRGYPLARVLDRRSVVDHPTTTMTVTLTVDAGSLAHFGPVAIEGLSSVEGDYVRSLLTWTQGEPYDGDKMERSRRALVGTGLFETVQIVPGAALDAQGGLPVAVRLSEAPHRSIGFGASYSTSEGLGGEVFWEHRNLMGRNEQLRLTLTAAEIEQALEPRFRKPGFLRPDQVLQVDAALANRDTDAFQEKSLNATVAVERPLGDSWRVSAGLSGEFSILEDEEGEETFQLFGLPLSGAYDTTDDPLDPTQGARLRVALTPYAGGGDGSLAFAVGTVTGSTYYALDTADRFVLAGRAKVGTVVGEDTEAVPANKRFYAGGGGSIRGFEFQSVGPLDAQDDPLGGRSIVEVNAEVRIRVTETIGIVPFVDGGTVYDSSYPDFDETLRWAAGLGARYFSAIGPLRLDVAVPLNRRDMDDSFEFYISLGQAF